MQVPNNAAYRTKITCPQDLNIYRLTIITKCLFGNITQSSSLLDNVEKGMNDLSNYLPKDLYLYFALKKGES